MSYDHGDKFTIDVLKDIRGQLETIITLLTPEDTTTPEDPGTDPQEPAADTEENP